MLKMRKTVIKMHQIGDFLQIAQFGSSLKAQWSLKFINTNKKHFVSSNVGILSPSFKHPKNVYKQMFEKNY